MTGYLDPIMSVQTNTSMQLKRGDACNAPPLQYFRIGDAGIGHVRVYLLTCYNEKPKMAEQTLLTPPVPPNEGPAPLPAKRSKHGAGYTHAILRVIPPAIVS